MAEKVIEEARGIVEEFRPNAQYGDSFKMNGLWYSYSKDGDKSGLPRVSAGIQVQITYQLWTRPGANGNITRRYLQSVEILGTMEDYGEPPDDIPEEAMLLEPRSAPAPTTNPPQTNGRAAGAQPSPPTQRSPQSPPVSSHLSPVLMARMEAAKVAATYLAYKEGVDTDEALLRCAEAIEAWFLEDRPHFVRED
jgi:hypothetical protein